MSGPPKTPTHLRLVRGNPSKRPINKNEPQPPKGVPPVPRHFDKQGKYWFNNPGNWQAAFFVYNGQVFIRSVLIQEASIDFAKITDSLQSSNFIPGVRGWNLPKNASPEFHGKLYADSGEFAFNGVNNTVVINGNGLTVNLSGGGRVVVGRWS